MKKWNSRDCIFAVLLVLLIFAFAFQNSQIRFLERQYNNLQDYAFSRIAQMSNYIDQLSVRINKLEEEASITTKVQYEIGQLHVNDGTIDVHVTILPKIMTEDMTAKINLWGEDTSLTRDGRAFVGTIPVNMFLTDGEEPLLVLTTDVGEETEFLPTITSRSLWKEYLPSLGVNINQGSVSEGEDHLLRLRAKGTLEAKKSETGTSFSSFALVVQVNGKEISRDDITQEVLTSDTYRQSGEYTRTFEILSQGSLDDDVIMYLEAVDEFGFIHECPLAFHRNNGVGTSKWYSYEESIYDPNGYLRFGPGKSLY